MMATSKPCNPTSVVQNCGNQITSVMEVLHQTAQSQAQQPGQKGCSNRLLLASGFLCLATWTLSGMGGVSLAKKIVQLHYLLSNIGQDTCSDKVTNPANPAELSLQAN